MQSAECRFQISEGDVMGWDLRVKVRGGRGGIGRNGSARVVEVVWLFGSVCDVTSAKPLYA